MPIKRRGHPARAESVGATAGTTPSGGSGGVGGASVAAGVSGSTGGTAGAGGGGAPSAAGAGGAPSAAGAGGNPSAGGVRRGRRRRASRRRRLVLRCRCGWRGGGSVDRFQPSSEDCAQPLAPGDNRKCTLTVGLSRRSYYLYAPPTYDPCRPTALVLDCHGAMETAEVQAGIDTLHIANALSGPLEYPGIGSGWRLEADTPGGGFIVVTPQGIDNVWTSSNDDPQFFLDIVAATKKIANIASDKVYMTGISNGSIISYTTSFCAAYRRVFGDRRPLGRHDLRECRQADSGHLVRCRAGLRLCQHRLGERQPWWSSMGAMPPRVPNWLTIDTNTTDAVCRNDPFDTRSQSRPVQHHHQDLHHDGRHRAHGVQALGWLRRQGHGGLLRRGAEHAPRRPKCVRRRTHSLRQRDFP